MKWIFPDKNPVIKTKLADLTEIDGAIKGWGWYFAAQQQQILSNNHPVFLMMFEIQKGAPNWRTHPVFDNCWKLDSWNMKCFFENMVEKHTTSHQLPPSKSSSNWGSQRYIAPKWGGKIHSVHEDSCIYVFFLFEIELRIWIFFCSSNCVLEGFTMNHASISPKGGGPHGPQIFFHV